VIRQSVNLRVGGSLQFDDTDSQCRYEDECVAAVARMTALRVRFAVAPKQALKTHDGRCLGPGAEVIPERDLLPAPGAPVWKQLRDLVFDRVLLEADLPEPPVAA
jgi:hypothetical protein